LREMRKVNRKTYLRIRRLLAEIGSALPRSVTGRLKQALNSHLTEREAEELAEDLERLRRMSRISAKRLSRLSEDLRTEVEKVWWDQNLKHS